MAPYIMVYFRCNYIWDFGDAAKIKLTRRYPDIYIYIFFFVKGALGVIVGGGKGRWRKVCMGSAMQEGGG